MAEIYYAKYSVQTIKYNHRNPDKDWTYLTDETTMGYNERVFQSAYESYEFIEGEGFKNLGEYGVISGAYTKEGPNGTSGYSVYTSDEVRRYDYVDFYVSGNYYHVRYKVWQKKCEYDIKYEKRNLITIILANEGDHPDNGIHTDGYWYVRFVPKYLGIIELGTLYFEDVEQPLPQDPRPYGDVPSEIYKSNFEKWQLGDTSDNPLNRLRWHKIRSPEGIILISDRVLLKSVSAYHLKSAGWLNRREITIDGKNYILRCLTGGIKNRLGNTDQGDYKGEMPNEWDIYIGNEFNISGIPDPDNINDLEDFWQINGFFNYCNDQFYEDGYHRTVYRGGTSITYWGWQINDVEQYIRDYRYGWRPVLEVMWEPPDISLNINGSLKKYDNGWIKVNGQLKEIDQMWVKENGVLKEV